MNDTTIIGIAGGTGSGKTTIAKELSSDFKSINVSVIKQDSYYYDLKDLNFEERCKINFDHPNAIDFPKLKNDLISLKNGEKIEVPIYNYNTHTRDKDVKIIDKHQIIILEGILSLVNKEIRNLMDIKIYVETPDDIRIIRRIKRDIFKRGRDFDSITNQYYSSVRPMHKKFVEPSKKYADIIIPEGGKNLIAIDILKTKIISILSKEK